ncbi:hypothetical protein PMZ80_007968 [Knufia obscura]|uniref:Uncharacterized protein n=1 Tax=Knufia obscura TaxID=1635080 RepID=A0ABR0RHA9_9EURO|nr:hypothetical protein PMZ80_007968 [Knufia obscura]
MAELEKEGFGEPQHPSFRRYFPHTQHDLSVVKEILRSVLSTTGCPGQQFEFLRACQTQPDHKQAIFYGDPPASIVTVRDLDCRRPGLQGYQNVMKRGALEQSFIALCPSFFTTYRPALAVNPVKNPFGPTVQKCNYYDHWTLEPTWSSAQVMLYELLHNEKFYEAHTIESGFTITQPVIDVLIIRPVYALGDGITPEKAYGSFRSMHVRDWSGGKEMTSNDDNFVFLVTEIYYKKIHNLQDWWDPIDPYYAHPCPPLYF